MIFTPNQALNTLVLLCSPTSHPYLKTNKTAERWHSLIGAPVKIQYICQSGHFLTELFVSMSVSLCRPPASSVTELNLTLFYECFMFLLNTINFRLEIPFVL